MNVNAQITQVTVSVLPDDDINHGSYAITVEYRGRDLWAVLHRRWCLARNGEWDYEVRPSEREDEWLAAHRFGYDEALQLAVRAAPKVVVNGRSAAEVAARADA